MSIILRPLQLPDDYGSIAELLNPYLSEPTSAAKLQEADAKLYEVGHTYRDENGLLAGYDRERRVAVDEQGAIVGYVWSWRAPWTEPGYLCNTLVVAEHNRKRGVGQLLLRHVVEWADKLGAAALMTEVWDDHPDARHFAEHRGFTIERHTFQSVLTLGDDAGAFGSDIPDRLEREGLRFVTLAEEPGEESERKLYELCKETVVDIPGYMGDVPEMSEWRKWYLQVDGYAPESVIIAAHGDRYVGVTNVVHNPQTNGMYHEYTGVSRDYRGRQIALALKIKAIRLALGRKAAYLRTDNDSINEPILAINRRLGYVPLRGSYRMLAPLEAVKHKLRTAVSGLDQL